MSDRAIIRAIVTTTLAVILGLLVGVPEWCIYVVSLLVGLVILMEGEQK